MALLCYARTVSHRQHLGEALDRRRSGWRPRLQCRCRASDIVSYAIVQGDGSLRVQGKNIRLFGVYLPRTDRGCRSDFLPPLCGNRSVCALNVGICGFVRCAPQAQLADGSVSAVCYVDGSSSTNPPVDLGAWLIEQGLAVAGPGAPFEYQTLQRIAEVNRRGVWGFPVDQTTRFIQPFQLVR